MMAAPSLSARTLDLAIAIQQIPAPTFAEQARGQFAARLFESEGLQDVTIDALGNVLARLPGTGNARPLVVSAHLDTVFPADADLKVTLTPDRIRGPGIGDNALGVAGLLGVLWSLRLGGTVLPGDIWLVANVGEEGLGNLCGMQAVVSRFGNAPRAYLVLEGLALGQVYHRALGSRRYRISLKTAGGHSWVDYGQPSAVHELSRLVTALADLPLPQQPRTTLNVGVFQGGISINTIASQAFIEVDLRSESTAALEDLERQALVLAAQLERPGVQFQVELVGQRLSGELPDQHPLVQLASQCLKEQRIQPILNIGSTDANVPLSQGLPAVCIGLSNGGLANTLGEYVLTAPLAQGLAQARCLVEGAFTALPA
jgi:acetylornithine deacetylase/succinyl-diaminopimelate desuccinylase-like protein